MDVPPKGDQPAAVQQTSTIALQCDSLAVSPFFVIWTRKDERPMTQPKPVAYPVYVGTRFPADLAQQVKATALKTNATMSDVVRQAVTAQLKQSPEVPG